MRLVKTTHKTLYEKSAFSKKAYHQRDDGFILLKTNCYYTDERGNTYYCFAGVGEFDIDSTKNINYDDVLDKNAFIDAKDNVALNYILDNASVIDKSYTDSIQNRLKVSDKKHTKIANALKEQELNVYNKEEINEKLENAYNDIQKLKDEIKALSSNYEKDLKQLQDKLSKNEQSIKNTIKAYKLNDDKKEALQDERIKQVLDSVDSLKLDMANGLTIQDNKLYDFKNEFLAKLSDMDSSRLKATKEKLYEYEWDIYRLGSLVIVACEIEVSLVVTDNYSYSYLADSNSERGHITVHAYRFNYYYQYTLPLKLDIGIAFVDDSGWLFLTKDSNYVVKKEFGYSKLPSDANTAPKGRNINAFWRKDKKKVFLIGISKGVKDE